MPTSWWRRPWPWAATSKRPPSRWGWRPRHPTNSTATEILKESAWPVTFLAPLLLVDRGRIEGARRCEFELERLGPLRIGLGDQLAVEAGPVAVVACAGP